jgi:hypothetical protein
VALLGLGVRRLQEPANAEQLGRHLGTATEVESLECAAPVENRTSRLPERAAGLRARCVVPRNLLETADSAHGATVHRRSHAHIGKSAHTSCGQLRLRNPSELFGGGPATLELVQLREDVSGLFPLELVHLPHLGLLEHLGVAVEL